MKRIIFVFWLGFQTVVYANFSDDAWKRITPIYTEIVRHPFNVELAKGTLPTDKFSYYSAQDSLYLTDFAKALGLLAVKLEDPKQVVQITEFVKDCLKEKDLKGGQTAMAGPATLFYTSYLLATAAHKSPEELAAAILPCFWIYLEVARELKKLSPADNPYSDWIAMYSSDKYAKDVALMIEIVNSLAEKTSPETRAKMLEAFTTASRLEWLFWDASYQMADWRLFEELRR